MKRVILFFLAAASFLAAATGSAILTDDTLQLPPGDWRWVRFEIRKRPATAICQFQALGGGHIRAEIVTRPNLELFRAHKSHDTLAVVDPMSAGAVTQYIQEPGEYAAIIENKDAKPVSVHLTVLLSFASQRPVARTLTPTRRLTVILVSFVLFFGIVTFSARALLKAMRRP